MATLPIGKGIWMWKYLASVDAIVADVVGAGLGHFAIKIVDGAYQYGESYPRQDLVNKLKAKGVQVWGWGYTYGASPEKEATLAARVTQDLGLDGFIINAEKEYKGKPLVATTYCRALRTAMPARSIGLSAYRYPDLHNDYPWAEFWKYVDYNMPQVYWLLSHNPVSQLVESMAQFKRRCPSLPYIPMGSAWKQPDWAASAADVKAFIQGCKDRNLPGCSFWEYNRAKDAGLWDAIASVPWTTAPPPPPPPGDPLEPRVEKLETDYQDLYDDTVAINGRVTKLENEPVVSYALPFAWFIPKGGSCVIQHVAKWNRTSSGIDKPIYAPVGDAPHPKINGKARVFPLPLTGDGGMTCYMLLDQTIDGETVYVRRQDGNLQ